jgi:hypothetical protein
MPESTVAEVLIRHTEELLAIPGVAILYESETEDGAPCIKVGVAEDTPEIRRRIPASLEGYPVLVVDTGSMEPH